MSALNRSLLHQLLFAATELALCMVKIGQIPLCARVISYVGRVTNLSQCAQPWAIKPAQSELSSCHLLFFFIPSLPSGQTLFI